MKNTKPLPVYCDRHGFTMAKPGGKLDCGCMAIIEISEKPRVLYKYRVNLMDSDN